MFFSHSYILYVIANWVFLYTPFDFGAQNFHYNNTKYYLQWLFSLSTRPVYSITQESFPWTAFFRLLFCGTGKIYILKVASIALGQSYDSLSAYQGSLLPTWINPSIDK